MEMVAEMDARDAEGDIVETIGGQLQSTVDVFKAHMEIVDKACIRYMSAVAATFDDREENDQVFDRSAA